jgi:hypothetical protein
MSSVGQIDKKEAPTKYFSFSRNELADLQQEFTEMLQSPEAIENEWIHLDGCAGNGVVSLAEVELWLCVRFPLLRNSVAIRMSFHKTLHLSSSKNGFIQKQAMRSLLIIIFCSNQALRWWNEIPSKSADKVLAWISSKNAKTLDERVSLETAREQLAPNQVLKNLQSRSTSASELKNLFCIEFELFCDLMASFKTTPIDIMYCNLEPCCVEPLAFSAKPRSLSEIQKRIKEKVVKATREQDHLCASSLPYMKSNRSHNASYSLRPSTSLSRPSTRQSGTFSKISPDIAISRPLSRESVRPFLTTPFNGKDIASKRPISAHESVLSILTGRSTFTGSLEACDSAGEIVPGVIFTQSKELLKTRRSYLKTFGLQHPHTGFYFHSLKNNDLLSEKQQTKDLALPDYASRLNESPLKYPTFQLLRDKPGKNPLAFSTDRSPVSSRNDSKLTLHPRRPWNCEFASSSNINGSFSLSCSEVAAAKNQSPTTRALSPNSAKLVSPAPSSKLSKHCVSADSPTNFRKISDWDSSQSPIEFFGGRKTRISASFANVKWA